MNFNRAPDPERRNTYTVTRPPRLCAALCGIVAHGNKAKKLVESKLNLLRKPNATSHDVAKKIFFLKYPFISDSNNTKMQ